MGDGRIREGDLESINRHISKHDRDTRNYPHKGRIVSDEQGRRVIYDSDPKTGRVKPGTMKYIGEDD